MCRGTRRNLPLARKARWQGYPVPAWAHIRAAGAELIPARVTAARNACDDALPTAIYLDTAYQCSYRQDEVRSRRARVDEIAAVYGL